MESSDIEKLIEETKVAAGTCGAIVLDSGISYEHSSFPTAVLAASQFPELLKIVKPKIVYLRSVVFDAGEFAKDSLEIDEDELQSNAKIRKLVSKWRKHDGDTSAVTLELMFDGIIHGATQQAAWAEDFDEEIELCAAEIKADHRQNEEKVTQDTKRLLAGKVKQLIADPRFSVKPVGTAKRTVLAESLFPDLDGESIRLVVEWAENEHWLSSPPRKS